MSAGRTQSSYLCDDKIKELMYFSAIVSLLRGKQCGLQTLFESSKGKTTWKVPQLDAWGRSGHVSQAR